MTAALLDMDVPRETIERLARFASLVTDASSSQNLIAASTIDDIWTRHIADSFQLLRLGAKNGLWLDIGSGAGFPGLVIAIAAPELDVCLVEPRRKRVEFLEDCVAKMGLRNVRVSQQRVESMPPQYAATISARAVASLDRLFAMGAPHATNETLWVLAKGKNVREEVSDARMNWQASINLVPSITDPVSRIVVARSVSRYGRRPV